MWGYFWLILASMSVGAFLMALGIFYGMFMMSLAMSEDEDDDDEFDRLS